MSIYRLNFRNNTEKTWTMAVYQELPSSVGLDSVAWKQTTAPKQGYTGVEWALNFNTVLAGYHQTGGIGVYMASQTLSADLGSVWKCIFQDDVQQLEFVSSTGGTPGQILIENHSNLFANLGIGMSGQASVYQKDVDSGANAQFVVKPVYYVGLFNKVVLGEVISDNVTVGPLKLVFPTGASSAELVATNSGENIDLALQYLPVTR